MFAKTVIGFVLVSVLPCLSQRNQFVGVPFDDIHDTKPISKFQQTASQSPVQLHHMLESSNLATATAPPSFGVQDDQPFGFNQQLLHNQQIHNNHINANPSFPSSRQQFVDAGLGQNPSLVGSFQDFSGVNGHKQRGHSGRANQVRISRRRPTTTTVAPHIASVQNFQASDFTANQPNQIFDFTQHSAQRSAAPLNNRFSDVMIIMPLSTSQIGAPPSHGLFVPAADHQFLDSVSQPQSPRLTNTFLNVEEPVLRPISHEVRKPVRFEEAFLTQARPAVRAPAVPQSQPAFQFKSFQNNQQVTQEPEFLINVQPSVRAAPQTLPSHQEFRAPQPNVRIPSQSIPTRHEAHRSPVPQGRQTVTDVHRQKDQELEELLFRQQAESAKYSFASQIDDSINGNQHTREEVRDGLAVKGMYSYSDGYVRRTVYYEADDKGYRVVKEEEQPLGDGPQVDPNGHADVATFVAGNSLQYSITAADIQNPKDIEAANIVTRRI